MVEVQKRDSTQTAQEAKMNEENAMGRLFDEVLELEGVAAMVQTKGEQVLTVLRGIRHYTPKQRVQIDQARAFVLDLMLASSRALADAGRVHLDDLDPELEERVPCPHPEGWSQTSWDELHQRETPKRCCGGRCGSEEVGS